MAYLKNIYIKTDKVKIWQMGFEFSAHLSCFTEETKLIWKLEDDISTTRKNKTKLTAKKTQKYLFILFFEESNWMCFNFRKFMFREVS